jgi:molecular chaperone DnaK
LGGVFQVRTTNGDTFLGGEDFDQRIIEHLAGLFEREHGIDLRHDRMALQRLREAAERAKHELSSALETDVQLPFIAAGPGGPLHFSTRLSRRQLETMTADLVERTLEPCRIALADAGLGPRDVEQVILVGGQTRMPLVQEKVGDFFQRRPHRAMNPDEVVAVGAAIQAAVLRGQMQDVLLLDVTPLSLGVETAGGVFTRLIARNTTIPTRKSEVFSTAVDNQPLVNVHVLQGEREMAADNKSLARLQLLDIPPAPRGVPQIEVSFEIDADGLVKVAARDLGTGKQQSASIVSTSGLTEEEVGRLLGEAESMREVDAGKRELAELRNRAATLIYGSERALLEDGYGIDDALRAGVDRDLAACREVVEGDDPGLLRAAVLALEASAHKITERIYAAAARPDGESPGRQS